MPDLLKVKHALELAMRVTCGEQVRREIEAALAELEPSDAQPSVASESYTAAASSIVR